MPLRIIEGGGASDIRKVNAFRPRLPELSLGPLHSFGMSGSKPVVKEGNWSEV